MLQDPDFLNLPGDQRKQVIDRVLSKDQDFTKLTPDDQFKVRSKLYVKAHDPKEDLPKEIMGVKVPPEVAAGVVGVGHGMQWAEEGIAQLTGVDVNKRPMASATPFDDLAYMVHEGIFGKDKEDVKAQATAKQEEFKKLEKDQQVGTAATIGNVAGQVASPTNLAVPGAIGATIPKMVASGAVIGGATGALSPVGEGESRWENAKQGAMWMAAGNLVLGTVFKAAKSMKGREAIPPSGEITPEVRENLKILNPGLDDATLDVINEKAAGTLNAQDRALKTIAKHPEVDLAMAESKDAPKEFRRVMQDEKTSIFVKQGLQKKAEAFAAITDDHEKLAFINSELNAEASVRQQEGSLINEERATRNPLTPEPVAPEEKAAQSLRLSVVRNEVGWAERGGKLIRKEVGGSFGEGEVVGRTKWIAKSDMWPGRPDKGLSEKAALAAVDKAAAGEKLKPIEQRFVDYANEHITERERPFLEAEREAAAERAAIQTESHPIWIPPGQAGRVAPAVLHRMAAAGVGSAAGAYLDPDNPLQGAIFGALAGYGAFEAGSLLSKGAKYLGEKFGGEDLRARIDHFADARDGEIRAWQRTTMQRQLKMESLVKPDVNRDKSLYLAATGEAKVPMTAKEAEFVKMARANMDEIGQIGLDAGAIEHLRENYITRLVDFGTQSKSEIMNLIKNVGQKGGGGSTATKTRFNKERVFDSLRDLEAAGYKLKTHNLSEIIGMYNNSVISAIENRKMIDAIKGSVAPNGDKLIIPLAGLRSLPKDYEVIAHPQLFGQAVHKDIAGSMRFIFDRQDPSTVGAAIQAAATAIKRGNVSFSLFHAMSLGQAYVGAIGGPKGLADILRAPFGKGGMEKMVQAFRTGGKGDIVDLGLRTGLRVGGATEDVDRTLLTAALRDVGQVVDRVIPLKAGERAASGIEAVNKLVDNITWGHAHTGMKLQVFAAKVETLMKNNITAHEKNPLIPLMTKEDAGKIASKFANTIFGGLDYRRLAEGIKNQYGRDLALWALSPSSRRVAQIMMFAPDWTLSTLQSLTGALGKGSGLGGVMNPRTLADLHRQYLARSAFYFAVIGDGLNYSFSGHHLWENKDPTRIDLGDGRTMQLSKHFTEPIHDIMHPDQATLNKLGVLPKQLGEQLMNKEYLSAGGSQSIIKPDDSFMTAAGKRLGHLVKSPIPIPVQQGIKQGPEAMALGMIGVPIYGQTYKEREESKKQAALTRLKNDLDPEKRAAKEAKKREKERQKRLAEQ